MLNPSLAIVVKQLFNQITYITSVIDELFIRVCNITYYKLFDYPYGAHCVTRGIMLFIRSTRGYGGRYWVKMPRVSHARSKAQVASRTTNLRTFGSGTSLVSKCIGNVRRIGISCLYMFTVEAVITPVSIYTYRFFVIYIYIYPYCADTRVIIGTILSKVFVTCYE